MVFSIVSVGSYSHYIKKESICSIDCIMCYNA